MKAPVRALCGHVALRLRAAGADAFLRRGCTRSCRPRARSARQDGSRPRTLASLIATSADARRQRLGGHEAYGAAGDRRSPVVAWFLGVVRDGHGRATSSQTSLQFGRARGTRRRRLDAARAVFASGCAPAPGGARATAAAAAATAAAAAEDRRRLVAAARRRDGRGRRGAYSMARRARCRCSSAAPKRGPTSAAARASAAHAARSMREASSSAALRRLRAAAEP